MQVFVPSKDGKVKIPMFIVHRNDVKLDGSNPAYLYAYGGESAASFRTATQGCSRKDRASRYGRTVSEDPEGLIRTQVIASAAAAMSQGRKILGRIETQQP